MARSYKKGVEYSVTEHLKVNPQNRVVILTDSQSSDIAGAIYNATKNVAAETYFFNMERYCNGKRKKFPNEIMDLFKDARKKIISFYLDHSLGGEAPDKYELLNLGDPVADLIDTEGADHIKHVSLPGITKQILRDGCCVPSELLKKGTTAVYNKLKNAKTIEIYSPGGTELELKIDPRNIGWRKEDHINYGDWENLPLGEVYTSPIDANGKLVVDCMVGGYEDKYGMKFLKRYPLTFKIANGKVIEISCRRSTHLVRMLDEGVLEGKRADIIGEIGFGTNFGLTKLIGNILQDEKLPGVHIGIGSAMPDCGEKWRSETHADVLMIEPTVFIDNKILIAGGNYMLDHEAH